jgi:hypothetical protein
MTRAAREPAPSTSGMNTATPTKTTTDAAPAPPRPSARPASEIGKHQPPSQPDELREEIKDLRAGLGDAVEALVHKTDVKARAQEKLAQGKEVAVQRGRQAGEFYNRHQPWSSRVLAAGATVLAGLVAVAGRVMTKRAAERRTVRGRIMHSGPGKAARRTGKDARKRARTLGRDAAKRARTVGKDAAKRTRSARKRASKTTVGSLGWLPASFGHRGWRR